MNYDIYAEDGIDLYIEGGYAKISGTVDEVEVEFDFIDESGDVVTGYFKGPVTRKYYSSDSFKNTFYNYKKK
ncbi:MAG: hypothetical protein JXR65_12070 [Bacteroidales bacterium]|nr:hypothetical protein [Bacteroidales bacterium]